MAKKAYVGVSGASKNVKGIYVGVNGVPKKVIKGYVGVNGVPKLFWEESQKTYQFEIQIKVSFGDGYIDVYNNQKPFEQTMDSLGFNTPYFYDASDGRTQINTYATKSVVLDTPTKKIIEHKCKFMTSGTALIIGSTSSKWWKVTGVSFSAGTQPEDPYYYFNSTMEISVL